MGSIILVFGFFNKSNLGDDYFITAFRHLFPDFDFLFTDHITTELLKRVSVVFFGGGSFLYAKPKIDDDAFSILCSKKIFYLGVGAETTIHDVHKLLMKEAKLIAIRSREQVDFIKKTLNANTMYCPDLVYSLQNQVVLSPKTPLDDKSILFIPNMEVVSKHSDPSWKHNAWEYFKSEFSQAMDALIEADFYLCSFAFCNSNSMNDNWAAIEIFNKMDYHADLIKKDMVIELNDKSFESVTELLSQFEIIITQRYHGIVLAEMTGIPCLALHHHDKLKYAPSMNGRSLSFYGLNKQSIVDEINNLRNSKFINNLPIESNIFIELQERVSDIINGG